MMIPVLSAILGSIFLALIVTGGCALLRAWKPEEFDDSVIPALPWKNRTLLVSLCLCIVCYAASYLLHGKDVPTAVLDVIFAAGMVLLAHIDLKKHIVPNKILLVLLAVWVTAATLGILFDTAAGVGRVFSALGGALMAGCMFFLCYLISGRQLGGGDVKLSVIMGLYLTGERVMGAVTYGVILCCVYSVVMLIRKKVTVKDGIPLVPFLYLGTVLTFVIVG